MVIQKKIASKKISIDLSHTLIDFNDGLIRKVYDIIFREMPVSQNRYSAIESEENTPILVESTFEFKWAGFDAKLSDQNDFIDLKLTNLQLSFQTTVDRQKSNSISVSNFQVIQDGQEIFMKYHSFAFDQ